MIKAEPGYFAWYKVSQGGEVTDAYKSIVAWSSNGTPLVHNLLGGLVPAASVAENNTTFVQVWKSTAGLRLRLPAPDHGTEAELAEWALGKLGQWFHIEREVPGTHCSGSRLRIDAVLRPRDPSGWKDKEPAFGVEFKLPILGESSVGQLSTWAAQAVDYTHVDWQGYGRLRVFMCPSPFTQFREGEWPALMARMLGQLGVGDLCQVAYKGWALMMNDQVMWSEVDGPRRAKQWGIRPRVGSR